MTASKLEIGWVFTMDEVLAVRWSKLGVGCDGEVMKQEVCEQLVTECEQACQKMGLDFYVVMKKAPAVLERWKPFFVMAKGVWEKSQNREDAIGYLLDFPDPDPVEFEKVQLLLRTVPHLLRGFLQDAAKNLPPSPGGRPHGLTPDQKRQICQQIGQLYAKGVSRADAKERMSQSYGVSLSTVQRAWQKRGAPSFTTTDS